MVCGTFLHIINRPARRPSQALDVHGHDITGIPDNNNVYCFFVPKRQTGIKTQPMEHREDVKLGRQIVLYLVIFAPANEPGSSGALYRAGSTRLFAAHFNLAATWCQAFRKALKSRALFEKRSNAMSSWSALANPRASQQRCVFVTQRYESIRLRVVP